MKNVFLLAGFGLLATAFSFAHAQTVGLVRESARVGELDSTFCHMRGTRTMDDGDSIVVVASDSCTPKYNSSRTEEFYVVAVRGKLASISKSAVFVSAEKKVPVFTELSSEERERLVEASKEASLELRRIQVKQALDAFDKTKPLGVALMSFGLFDVSEHTEGTGFRFRVGNPTTKTIKYVTASLVGLNAVKDPVRTLRGATTVTLRGVGPIEPNGEGTYSWDYVWHTDLPEYVRWVSLKVEYMDGSSRVISRPLDVLLEQRHVRTIDSSGE